MRIIDTLSRPRFFIPDSLLGVYETVALTVQDLEGASLYGSPITATQVGAVPGVYATDAFALSDEGLLVMTWDLDGTELSWHVNARHDADGDSVPGAQAFLYEAPQRTIGLEDMVLDVYDALGSYALVASEVPSTEHAHFPGVYQADAVNLTEGVYLLHWRRLDDNPNFRAADVARVYLPARKRSVAIELAIEGEVLAGANIALLDSDGLRYAAGRTDLRGKVVFSAGRGQYTMILEMPGSVLSENNVLVDTRGGDVVMCLDLRMAPTPASALALDDDALVTLTWTSRKLDGSVSRAAYHIESARSLIDTGSGEVVIAGTALSGVPGPDGVVSITVPKNAELLIMPPFGPTRKVVAVADGNPFGDYAGVSVSSATFVQALPVLPRRA